MCLWKKKHFRTSGMERIQKYSSKLKSCCFAELFKLKSESPTSLFFQVGNVPLWVCWNNVAILWWRAESLLEHQGYLSIFLPQQQKWRRSLFRKCIIVIIHNTYHVTTNYLLYFDKHRGNVLINPA